jgi:hypothetical protein
MKKILFAAVAVAAICFTSCGNKTQQAEGEAVDSVALIDSLSEEAVHESIDALSGVITAKDADKLKDILESCKAKALELVKENPELAKSYLVKVQNFLKENKRNWYQSMMLSGRLENYLQEIDEQANERMELTVSQMVKTEGLTEQLKADDPMTWVARMNNIRSRAEEIVLAELIYS